MNVQAEQTSRVAPDLWDVSKRWLAEHDRVSLATVVSAWGSAPVPPGGMLVVAPGDRFEGSVSGGCVEVDVLVEAAEAMADGKPRLLEFGISDETAWRAGLACGGSIKILVEPLTRDDLPTIEGIVAARLARKAVLVTTRIADGTRTVYSDDDVPTTIAPFMVSGATGVSEDGAMLVRPIVAPLRIVVAGATHIGQVFAEMARLAGYSVTVVDPRAVFASAERFGPIAALSEWPQDSFDKIGLDGRTAVVAVTHASHIDDEALTAALRSPAMYIGALGSRATHAKRLDRLKAAGFGEEELKRIHAPIGLNIGAKGPAEIAVSILAEIIKVARGSQ